MLAENGADIAARRAGPPPQVIAQIALAAAAHERLRRRGKEIRFRLGTVPGGVQVELRDRVRGTVCALTIGEAFALACPLPAA
jgi:hypothetical protein